jgi:hypothetical protein
MKRAKARAAPATTSWTLVGPYPGKYYLVGPHSQGTVLDIVFWMCLRVVCLRVTDHHFSIQEVDHEKQMFAGSAALSARAPCSCSHVQIR